MVTTKWRSQHCHIDQYNVNKYMLQGTRLPGIRYKYRGTSLLGTLWDLNSSPYYRGFPNSEVCNREVPLYFTLKRHPENYKSELNVK